MIPELNKEYDYFDDGKINPSRHDKVTITELVRFNKIDNDTLREWKEQIIIADHLFAKETDYFVKGRLKEAKQDLIFVRTKDNGWFSFNNYMWDGRLDTDGSLIARLNGL